MSGAHLFPDFPQEPVDGYKLRWFTVDWVWGVPEVKEHYAVYRANSTWAQLYPGDTRSGADFVDEWQLYYQDRCIGRNVGWLGQIRSLRTYGKIFASRDTATLEAIRQGSERLRELRHKHHEIAAAVRAMKVSP